MTPKPENPNTHAKKHVVRNRPKPWKFFLKWQIMKERGGKLSLPPVETHLSYDLDPHVLHKYSKIFNSKFYSESTNICQCWTVVLSVSNICWSCHWSNRHSGLFRHRHLGIQESHSQFPKKQHRSEVHHRSLGHQSHPTKNNVLLEFVVLPPNS